MNAATAPGPAAHVSHPAESRWTRPEITAQARAAEGKTVRITYNGGPHYRRTLETITGTVVGGGRDEHVTLLVRRTLRKGIHVTRVRNIDVVD